MISIPLNYYIICYNRRVIDQQMLYTFLIIALLIVTTCIVFITYYMIQALKSITTLAENLIETTEGLKNKVGLKALAAIPPILVALVGKIIRRGR